MGWSSGASLFDELIEILMSEVKDDNARRNIYRVMIDAFEDEDADTLDECKGTDKIYDAVYDEIHADDDHDYTNDYDDGDVED